MIFKTIFSPPNPTFSNSLFSGNANNPVRDYRSVENCDVQQNCIPLGMQPVLCHADTFLTECCGGDDGIVSTERESLTGFSACFRYNTLRDFFADTTLFFPFLKPWVLNFKNHVRIFWYPISKDTERHSKRHQQDFRFDHRCGCLPVDCFLCVRRI